VAYFKIFSEHLPTGTDENHRHNPVMCVLLFQVRYFKIVKYVYTTIRMKLSLFVGVLINIWLLCFKLHVSLVSYTVQIKTAKNTHLETEFW
jgi:hypothetical protein